MPKSVGGRPGKNSAPTVQSFQTKQEAQGKRTDIQPADSTVGKYDVIEKAGFTPKQVERFQTLAAHPEIVEQAKAEARENDDNLVRAGDEVTDQTRCT